MRGGKPPPSEKRETEETGQQDAECTSQFRSTLKTLERHARIPWTAPLDERSGLKHGKALFAAESPATTRHAAFTRALLDQLAVRFPQPEVPDEVERVSSPSCTS